MIDLKYQGLLPHHWVFVVSTACVLFTMIFGVADCGGSIACWELMRKGKLVVTAFGFWIITTVLVVLIEVILMYFEKVNE